MAALAAVLKATKKLSGFDKAVLIFLNFRTLVPVDLNGPCIGVPSLSGGRGCDVSFDVDEYGETWHGTCTGAKHGHCWHISYAQLCLGVVPDNMA